MPLLEQRFIAVGWWVWNNHPIILTFSPETFVQQNTEKGKECQENKETSSLWIFSRVVFVPFFFFFSILPWIPRNFHTPITLLSLLSHRAAVVIWGLQCCCPSFLAFMSKTFQNIEDCAERYHQCQVLVCSLLEDLLLEYLVGDSDCSPSLKAKCHLETKLLAELHRRLASPLGTWEEDSH